MIVVGCARGLNALALGDDTAASLGANVARTRLLAFAGAVVLAGTATAVAGPIAYDLASLLRDAFHSWEEEREIDWAVRYWQAARQATLPVAEDFGDFWRQLEWIGLQRHLKVLGIFCRLKHRDGKPAYSEDLPRFFAYATKVATRYRELQPLLALLEPLSGIKPLVGFSMR